MKRAVCFAWFTAVLACGTSWAQMGKTAVLPPSAAGTAHPSAYNFPSAAFPRIEADNRVTFQFKAPDAQKVQVSIANRPFDMVKGENGVMYPLYDWRAHGWINLTDAIAWSSNIYFYMASCGILGQTKGLMAHSGNGAESSPFIHRALGLGPLAAGFLLTAVASGAGGPAGDDAHDGARSCRNDRLEGRRTQRSARAHDRARRRHRGPARKTD